MNEALHCTLYLFLPGGLLTGVWPEHPGEGHLSNSFLDSIIQFELRYNRQKNCK